MVRRLIWKILLLCWKLIPKLKDVGIALFFRILKICKNRRFQKALCFIICFSFLCFTTNYYVEYAAKADFLRRIHLQKIDLNSGSGNESGVRLLVNDEKCPIPNIDPWNEGTKKERLKNLSDYRCSNKVPHVTYVKYNELFINQSALSELGIQYKPGMCCYWTIHRLEPEHFNQNDTRNKTDNIYRYSESCIQMDLVNKPKSRFLKVDCNSTSHNFSYMNFHMVAILPPYKKLEGEIHKVNNEHEGDIEKKMKFWNDCRDGTLSPSNSTEMERNLCFKFKNSNGSWAPPNILMIGIDSVSRLQFHRFMVKTKEKFEKMGMVEMLGHIKAGYSTLSSMLPMLTSYNVWEIMKLCLKKPMEIFDSCPFIWSNFSQQHYLTAHLEDHVRLGGFNYADNGFKKQPTDVFPRQFFMALYDYLRPNMKPHSSYLHCSGYERPEEMILNHVTDMMINFSSPAAIQAKTYIPSVITMWLGDLTHEFFNPLEVFDETLPRVIDRLERHQLLDNTVLVFISDHGYRHLPIRKTLPGYYELHTPTFWIRIPPAMLQDFPGANDALIHNSRRLVTSYDLYATWGQIFRNNHHLPSENEINRGILLENPSRAKPLRGISLFTKIPSRTCEEAGIRSEYCVCSTFLPLTDMDTLWKASKALLAHTNNLLSEEPDCVTHKLFSVFLGTVLRLRPSNSSSNSATISKNGTSAASSSSSSSQLHHSTLQLTPEDLLLVGIITSPLHFSIQASLSYDNKTGGFTKIEDFERIDQMKKKPDCLRSNHNMYVKETICVCKSWLTP